MAIVRGTLTLVGPSYWASAIINGDYSGLEPDEQAQCRAWIARECGNEWTIVDCLEDTHRFTWSLWVHAPECNCKGGAVVDYVAITK